MGTWAFLRRTSPLPPSLTIPTAPLTLICLWGMTRAVLLHCGRRAGMEDDLITYLLEEDSPLTEGNAPPGLSETCCEGSPLFMLPESVGEGNLPEEHLVADADVDTPPKVSETTGSQGVAWSPMLSEMGTEGDFQAWLLAWADT